MAVDGKDRRRWMVFASGAGRDGKPEHKKCKIWSDKSRTRLFCGGIFLTVGLMITFSLPQPQYFGH